MKKINIILTSIALTSVMASFTACGEENFTDPRDGQKYKTVKIGDQVWMAENLKYKGGAESVYDGGSRFVWDSALVACPEGWRLPSKLELETVIADTNFGSTWSSMEKEDLSLSAYVKVGDKLTFAVKSNAYTIRCLQGKGEYQRLQEVKGRKVLRIGKQIWMANNLNIETPTSICYLEDESECFKGRFYTVPESKNVCPEGWRLPNKKEAASLINKLSKFCKDAEPYTRSLHDCSFVREFWGPKMGYYDNESQFKDGTGIMIIGYLLLSNGFYLENHVDLSIHDLGSWMKKMNVRCIADTDDKE